MRALGVLLLLAVVLATAAPAGAAPTRTAQRFSDAVLHARVAIKAQRDEFRERWEALNLELCFEALDGAPERAADRAGLVVGLGLSTTFNDLLLPHLRQVVAELDAVPTRDRVLRSGRAAWREMVRLLGGIPRVEDPCGQLARWRDAGWAPEAAPPVPDYDIEALEKRGDRLERKLKRAARRLRRLGLSRAAARRFTGETLLEGMPTPFDDAPVPPPS